MPPFAMIATDETERSTEDLLDSYFYVKDDFLMGESNGSDQTMAAQPVTTVYFESLKVVAPKSGSFSPSDTSTDDDSQEQSIGFSQPLLLGENLYSSPCVEKIDPSHISVGEHAGSTASFLALRSTYLLVTLVIMLADGLQGM
jgi:hypothetical protein